jgi:hypothetical protein
MASRPIYTHGQFNRALEAQARIGWERMLQGYWLQEWQVAYEATFNTPITEEQKDKTKPLLHMSRWQKNIIKTVWGVMIKLRKLRNDEHHGWDQESRGRSCHKVLHYELEEIYNHKDEYPQRVQNLLQASYKIHMQETVTKLADWLEAYKGTFAIAWSPD